MKIILLTLLFLSPFSIQADMKILCITHADFETPGVIQDWATQKNFDFKIVKPYNGENCLQEKNFDFLIIMGGPQSACNLVQDPYLYDEVKLIKQAIEENKIVLGFCLGAQLIGSALDAPASRSPEKEVGVFSISLSEIGKKDHIFKNFNTTFDVIHWHNDMPGLTPDSQILAYSAGCPRQIIRYKKNVYGLQCHLEITHEGIKTMIDACPDDLKPSTYTQTKQQLLANDYQSINNLMIEILNTMIML